MWQRGSGCPWKQGEPRVKQRKRGQLGLRTRSTELLLSDSSPNRPKSFRFLIQATEASE